MRRVAELHTIHGVERTEYECGRRPEFVHRTQGEAHCNYWTDASYEIGED